MMERCVGYVTSFRENARLQSRSGSHAIRVVQTIVPVSRMATALGREWEAHNGIRVR